MTVVATLNIYNPPQNLQGMTNTVRLALSVGDSTLQFTLSETTRIGVLIGICSFLNTVCFMCFVLQTFATLEPCRLEDQMPNVLSVDRYLVLVHSCILHYVELSKKEEMIETFKFSRSKEILEFL